MFWKTGRPQEAGWQGLACDIVILDTTFLIDLLRGNKAAIDKIAEIEGKNEPVSTTAISVFEVWQGLPKKASSLQVEKALELLKSINILRLDFESALQGGEIQRELKSSGQMIDPEDAMIAGIAKINNEKILTRNAKHFEKIRSVKTEIY